MRKLQAWGSCSSLMVQGRACLPLPHIPCLSPCTLAAMILPSGLAGTAFGGKFPCQGGTATKGHLCHYRRGRWQQGTALTHLLVPLLEILALWQQGERQRVLVDTHEVHVGSL